MKAITLNEFGSEHLILTELGADQLSIAATN